MSKFFPRKPISSSFVVTIFKFNVSGLSRLSVMCPMGLMRSRLSIITASSNTDINCNVCSRPTKEPLQLALVCWACCCCFRYVLIWFKSIYNWFYWIYQLILLNQLIQISFSILCFNRSVVLSLCWEFTSLALGKDCPESNSIDPIPDVLWSSVAPLFCLFRLFYTRIHLLYLIACSCLKSPTLTWIIKQSYCRISSI